MNEPNRYRLILVNLMVMMQAFCTSLYAQDAKENYSGKYSYAVVDTPYGDYFGWVILAKKGKHYQGEIVNEEGKRYRLWAIRTAGSKMIFKSDVEETRALFTVEMSGDSIQGNIRISGDDFHYILKGRKCPVELPE